MPSTPSSRTERLLRHVRAGWARVRSEEQLRQRVARWIAEHPSRWPDIDALWARALELEGPLPTWLDEGADPASYEEPLPLHSVLASHPFVALDRWSIPRT